MTHPVKVGIIGVGGVATLHYPGFVAAEAEIKAMADLDARALARRQRAWGVPDVYEDYRKLLEDPEIEAVTICLPNALHHEATLAAARAGKHVYCEKPISLSLRQAQEMIDVCREEGVVLQVGHHLRSLGAAEKVKAMIASGELGELTYLRLRQAHDWAGAQSVRRSFGTFASAGGGTLLDNGVHMLDLARYFAGDVREVYARIATRKFAIEVEDTAVVNLTFESGAFGTVESAWTATGWEESFAVYGTKGAVEYTNRPEPVMHHRFRESPGTTWGEPDVAVYRFAGLQTHARAIVEFLQAVRGEESVPCTGEDGLEAVRLVLAAYESTRHNRPLPLSELPADSALPPKALEPT
jgi:predicted dehydrogenase